MTSTLNRRSFLGMGFAASAAMLAPRWIQAQATDRLAQMRAGGASTPIKITKLYNNLYLLQGAGGNMAVQTGPDGKILLDSSFSTVVPKIREALDSLSKDPADTLINTHWHADHTDGNEGMHAAGFTIVAHQNTRERLSKPQMVEMVGFEFPAAPAGGRPVVTFDQSLHMYRNGDSIDLVHFDPAHTDTDIYIHFHKADVLHIADTWFNGIYPFIDYSTGGNIGGMIKANEKALAIASDQTKIIPGHGPLGTKAQLQQFHDMLAKVRDNVAALKKAGASQQEVIAKKPTAEFDAVYGKGMVSPDTFTGFVYRTV